MPEEDPYTPDDEHEPPRARPDEPSETAAPDEAAEQPAAGLEPGRPAVPARDTAPPSAYPPQPPPGPGYPPPHPGYPPPHPGYPPPPGPGYPPPLYPTPHPWEQTGLGNSSQPAYQPGGGFDVAPGDLSTAASASLDVGRPATQKRERRKIILVVLAAVLVAGLLAGGGVWLFAGSSSPSSSTSAPISPAARAVLERALANARAAGSFHYVSVSNSSATGTFTTLGDAGESSGKQQITTNSPNGTASFTVIVIGNTCYFQGDSLAMQENLDVSAAVAQAYAEQWISLSPSDAPYASVYAAVDTHDALYDNIAFKPQRDMGTSTISSRRVRTISGATTPVKIPGEPSLPIKGTATLEVSAATHLPVRYSESGTLSTNGQSEHSSFTMTFSDFGEEVSESTPPGAVPFPSLGSTGGGGGSSTSPKLVTSARR